MKRLFISKPSGGGWLVDEGGSERACCECEVEGYLTDQILALFDEEEISGVMITVETIKEMKVDKCGLKEQKAAKRKQRGWGILRNKEESL